MPQSNQPLPLPDWDLFARACGFQIPEGELRGIAEILERLVSACREGFDDSLHLVQPVGSFRLEELPPPPTPAESVRSTPT